MPNLDRLASLSKKMKEVRVVVAPGGGQEGSEAAVAAAILATPGATNSVTLAGDMAAELPAPAHTASGGSYAPLLADIRDALRELVAETRAARAGGASTAAIEDIKAQLDMQGEQLAEILTALKSKK